MRANRYLAIYLNDHLAAVTALVALLDRMAGQYRDGELAEFVAHLRPEIEEDRRTLEQIMASLSVSPDRAKVALARVAERLGRLKLNGQLRGRSPLTPVVELESLALGVTAQLSMWRALREIGIATDRIDGLIARAERQREEVERQRLAAARHGLTG